MDYDLTGPELGSPRLRCRTKFCCYPHAPPWSNFTKISTDSPYAKGAHISAVSRQVPKRSRWCNTGVTLRASGLQAQLLCSALFCLVLLLVAPSYTPSWYHSLSAPFLLSETYATGEGQVVLHRVTIQAHLPCFACFPACGAI